MPIEVVSGDGGGTDLQEKFSSLFANTDSENMFFDWWMLSPALRELVSPDEDVRVVLIWNEDRSGLIGVFPLRWHRRYSSLPISYFSLWHHYHCLISEPIIRRGYERRCLQELFAWAESGRPAGYFFNFSNIELDSPFSRFIAAERRHFPCSQAGSFQRALLLRKGDFQTFLKNLPRKRRKELERLRRRLAEEGVLETAIYDPSTSIIEFSEIISAFIELEARGWKGRNGSALQCRENEERYFRAICREAAKRRALSFVGLTLNGRFVALECNLHSRTGMYSYKIAFDETYAHCSPGLLVSLENTRYFLESTSLKWFDSGAEPGHPMIDRLWPDRREIVSVNVGLPGLLPRLLFQFVLAAKRAYSWAAPLLRNQEYRYRKSGGQKISGVCDEFDIKN